MKKLTKKSLDELALIMPVISEKNQQECVGGTGSVSTGVSIWNSSPDGTNTVWTATSTGFSDGNGFEIPFSPTGDISGNFTGNISGQLGSFQHPYTAVEYWMLGFGTNCYYLGFDGKLQVGLESVTVHGTSYGHQLFKGTLSECIASSQTQPEQGISDLLTVVGGNAAWGASYGQSVQNNNSFNSMVSQKLAERGDSAGTIYVWSLKDGYCNVRISGSETIIYSVKYDTTSTPVVD